MSCSSCWPAWPHPSWCPGTPTSGCRSRRTSCGSWSACSCSASRLWPCCPRPSSSRPSASMRHDGEINGAALGCRPQPGARDLADPLPVQPPAQRAPGPAQRGDAGRAARPTAAAEHDPRAPGRLGSTVGDAVLRGRGVRRRLLRGRPGRGATPRDGAGRRVRQGRRGRAAGAPVRRGARWAAGLAAAPEADAGRQPVPPPTALRRVVLHGGAPARRPGLRGVHDHQRRTPAGAAMGLASRGVGDRQRAGHRARYHCPTPTCTRARERWSTARACCSTPTAWSSPAPGTSTRASRGCGRPRGTRSRAASGARPSGSSGGWRTPATTAPYSS